MIENKIQITTSILALVAQLTKQNKPIPIEIQKIKENPDTCTDMELLQALQVASLPCYAGTTQGNLIKTMVGLTDDYKAIFTPYQTYILDTSALNWRDENYTILEYLEKIQLFAGSEPPEGAVHQIWDAFLGMIKSVSVSPPSKVPIGRRYVESLRLILMNLLSMKEKILSKSYFTILMLCLILFNLINIRLDFLTNLCYNSFGQNNGNYKR